MCILIHAPKGTDVPHEYLAKGMIDNDDGWGLVALNQESGEILVKRNFSWKLAFKYWDRWADYERVFHARAASPGTLVNFDNLHPFRMKSPSGEERYFFHNGRVNRFPEVNGRYCDSWHVAKYFSNFNTNQKFDQVLGDLAVAEDSRFALVRPAGVSRYGKGWCVHKGVYYSNPGIFAKKIVKYANNGKNVYEGLNEFPETFYSDKSWNFIGMSWDEKEKLYVNREKPKQYAAYDFEFETEHDWRMNRRSKHKHEKPIEVKPIKNGQTVTVSDSDWEKLFAPIIGAPGLYQSKTTHAMKDDPRAHVAIFTVSRIWICAVPTEYLTDAAFLRYAVRRHEGLPHEAAVNTCKNARFDVPPIKYFRPAGVYDTRVEPKEQETFENTLSEQVRQVADKAEKRLACVRDAIDAGASSELTGTEVLWALEDGSIESLTLDNWRKRLEFWTTEKIRQGLDDDAIEDFREEHMRTLLILNPQLTVADMFNDLLVSTADVKC